MFVAVMYVEVQHLISQPTINVCSYVNYSKRPPQNLPRITWEVFAFNTLQGE